MFNLLSASANADLAIQTDAPVATTTIEVAGEGAPAAPWTEQIGPFVLPVLMVAFVWFIMIRPENKRRKEMNKFREGLKKGDKVVTAGGIHGSVKEIKDNTVVLEIDNNVNIRIDKSMVVAAPATK